jgi:O-antigen ligase
VKKVGLCVLGLGAVVWILFFQQHTWKVILCYSFLGFLNFAFGFMVADLELALLLSAVLGGTTWWHKNVMERPPVLKHWVFGWFNTICFLWLLYVVGHTIYNIYEPFRPQDYSFKNLIRTTEIWTGPLFMAFYFSLRPRWIMVRQSFPRVMAWLMFFSLVVNILIRLYHFVTGEIGGAFDPNDPMSAMEGYVTIPILELTENVFALRGLAPLVMLFSGACVSTQWFKQQSRGTRRLFHILMILSLTGAAMSGGRGTLAVTMVLFMGVLFVQKRVGLLMACLGAFAVMLAAANVLSDYVRKAPPLLRRSVNWALIHPDAEATESISGSSDWRFNLFQAALDEWKSDPRIFWFGRATYAYGSGDFTAILLQGEEGKLQTSLRRGDTHNMVTDLLVCYGICGLILFFATVLSFLYLVWMIRRSEHTDELGKMMALVIFVQMGYTFAYGVLGGGNFPVQVAWLYIVLVSWLYHQHHSARSEEARPAIQPRKSNALPERRVVDRPVVGMGS